jgi:hypothetical protein
MISEESNSLSRGFTDWWYINKNMVFKTRLIKRTLNLNNSFWEPTISTAPGNLKDARIMSVLMSHRERTVLLMDAQHEKIAAANICTLKTPISTGVTTELKLQQFPTNRHVTWEPTTSKDYYVTQNSKEASPHTKSYLHALVGYFWFNGFRTLTTGRR